MSARIIQVRPSRNPRWQKQDGWEVFEAEGVSPVYCGENGREQALSYAHQRAGYGRCDQACPCRRPASEWEGLRVSVSSRGRKYRCGGER
jgi:hypothetical protein